MSKNFFEYEWKEKKESRSSSTFCYTSLVKLIDSVCIVFKIGVFIRRVWVGLYLFFSFSANKSIDFSLAHSVWFFLSSCVVFSKEHFCGSFSFNNSHRSDFRLLCWSSFIMLIDSWPIRFRRLRIKFKMNLSIVSFWQKTTDSRVWIQQKVPSLFVLWFSF